MGFVARTRLWAGRQCDSARLRFARLRPREDSCRGQSARRLRSGRNRRLPPAGRRSAQGSGRRRGARNWRAPRGRQRARAGEGQAGAAQAAAKPRKLAVRADAGLTPR